jgi:hypothetical protein
MAELELRETYNLSSGEFIRTESERYDPVPDADGERLVNPTR